MRRAAAQKNKAERTELEKGIDLIEAPVARLHKQQAAEAAAALQAEPEQVSALDYAFAHRCSLHTACMSPL